MNHSFETATEHRSNYGPLFLFIFLLVAGLILLDLFIGSIRIPAGQILKILSGCNDCNPVWQTIILDARLPRVMTAILAGIALPVSGLLMQSFFRNPIAGPFILGVSSGASLGVALVLMGGGALGWQLFDPLKSGGALGLIVAASLGAAGVLIIVLSVAGRVSDVMTLLILGLMFGSFVSALVGLLQYFSEREALRAFIHWTFGSLGGVSKAQLYVLTPTVLFGLIGALLLSKSMKAFLLGEHQAASLGVNVHMLRYAVILLAGLLAGGITAFCGPIAFVGIAVPHLARILFKRSDHLVLIPATALLGIICLLICDLISRAPWAAYSLPVNAVTSLLGAPAVILIVMRNRNMRQFF